MISTTQRQGDLLAFIKAHIEKHDGLSPSFEEMQVELNLSSKSGIHRLLTGLEERGLIRRMQHRARAIEVVEHANAATREARATRIIALVRHCLAEDVDEADMIRDVSRLLT